MNNTRFATALHILTLLANSKDEWLSSEWIAASINVNAVIVRREIGVLMKAGLVQSRKGNIGGTILARSSNEIMLDEVYLAVKNSEVLGKKNMNPNPKCPIGKDINQKLDGLIAVIDQSVINELRHKSLESFLLEFQ